MLAWQMARKAVSLGTIRSRRDPPPPPPPHEDRKVRAAATAARRVNNVTCSESVRGTAPSLNHASRTRHPDASVPTLNNSDTNWCSSPVPPVQSWSLTEEDTFACWLLSCYTRRPTFLPVACISEDDEVTLQSWESEHLGSSSGNRVPRSGRGWIIMEI